MPKFAANPHYLFSDNLFLHLESPEGRNHSASHMGEVLGHWHRFRCAWTVRDSFIIRPLTYIALAESDSAQHYWFGGRQ